MKALIEFFTAQICNKNKRLAYGRAVIRFLRWADERCLELHQVEPVHVAGYVEDLSRSKEDGGGGFAIASIKQNLSGLKMLGSYLVIRQILPPNPAALLRSPRHVVRARPTSVLEGLEAREHFNSIDGTKPGNFRDRALLGVMTYTFARIFEVLALDVSDYYQVGRRMVFRKRLKSSGFAGGE